MFSKVNIQNWNVHTNSNRTVQSHGMSAVRDDTWIVVAQAREHLLTVVNKENEIKEFHFFLQSILPMVSVQKLT